MKTTARAISSMIMFLGTVATAYASGPREDNSGIFVWVFLAFCALIVVAQLIPALLVMLGIVKGISSAPKALEEEVAHETDIH